MYEQTSSESEALPEEDHGIGVQLTAAQRSAAVCPSVRNGWYFDFSLALNALLTIAYGYCCQ
jgi:hypothetical protein